MICACGYMATVDFAQCPRCRAWQTRSGSEGVHVPDRDERAWAPKKLSQIPIRKVERVSLQNEVLDTLFNGGMVIGCSYLFSGPPGFGKSTLALQALQYFERPLYVTSEEGESDLKIRAKRFGARLAHAQFLEMQDLEVVMRNMTDAYDGVVYDSAHRFFCDDVRAQPGTSLQVAAVIGHMHDMACKMGHVAVIIGQVNKDGDASGSMANQHEVTGVVDGIKRRGATRVLRMRKHRHGPDSEQLGKMVVCELGEQGLHSFDLVDDDRSEKGE